MVACEIGLDFEYGASFPTQYSQLFSTRSLSSCNREKLIHSAYQSYLSQNKITRREAFLLVCQSSYNQLDIKYLESLMTKVIVSEVCDGSAFYFALNLWRVCQTSRLVIYSSEAPNKNNHLLSLLSGYEPPEGFTGFEGVCNPFLDCFPRGLGQDYVVELEKHRYQVLSSKVSKERELCFTEESPEVDSLLRPTEALSIVNQKLGDPFLVDVTVGQYFVHEVGYVDCFFRGLFEKIFDHSHVCIDRLSYIVLISPYYSLYGLLNNLLRSLFKGKRPKVVAPDLFRGWAPILTVAGSLSHLRGHWVLLDFASFPKVSYMIKKG